MAARLRVPQAVPQVQPGAEGVVNVNAGAPGRGAPLVGQVLVEDAALLLGTAHARAYADEVRQQELSEAVVDGYPLTGEALAEGFLAEGAVGG